MEITIRYGNAADLATASSFDRYTPEHILVWKLEHHDILLAEDERGCVGYLKLEHLWSQFPYIGLIKVKEEYRGGGIGKRMLHFVITQLQQQGVHALYSSSQADEPDPQRWHRKMGFFECGIINGINDGNVGEIFFVIKF
ncbi:acetyltransferase (GNAT) family protein [Paenibacillus taihuensis]|uniref:Acetyltransferase (GNAT) family protein n=1 Tax=Paenibacillus taihuensis TaxID=1156355 RepID=A0A3D9RWL7_9BACL|nr:GNAT family N-acetyltransferase [Paenibacillus taihuensis]REE84389.1 acetyltransferase (GNAT) family protein [Paenibacillus taihuensis]